jgi:hypothetical protein
LRKRLVDHWHRLDRLLERYKTALADVGHNGRSGDQFGTLLAVADLLLYDGEDEENILFWADRFKAADLAEKETDLSDEEESRSIPGDVGPAISVAARSRRRSCAISRTRSRPAASTDPTRRPIGSRTPAFASASSPRAAAGKPLAADVKRSSIWRSPTRTTRSRSCFGESGGRKAIGRKASQRVDGAQAPGQGPLCRARSRNGRRSFRCRPCLI